MWVYASLYLARMPASRMILGRSQTCTTLFPVISSESSTQNVPPLDVQLRTALRRVLEPSDRATGRGEVIVRSVDGPGQVLKAALCLFYLAMLKYFTAVIMMAINAKFGVLLVAKMSNGY